MALWSRTDHRPAAPVNNLVITIPFQAGRAIGTVLFSLKRGAWVWRVEFRAPRARTGEMRIRAVLDVASMHAGWVTTQEALEALQAVMVALESGMSPNDLGELAGSVQS